MLVRTHTHITHNGHRGDAWKSFSSLVNLRKYYFGWTTLAISLDGCTAGVGQEWHTGATQWPPSLYYFANLCASFSGRIGDTKCCGIQSFEAAAGHIRSIDAVLCCLCVMCQCSDCDANRCGGSICVSLFVREQAKIVAAILEGGKTKVVDPEKVKAIVAAKQELLGSFAAVMLMMLIASYVFLRAANKTVGDVAAKHLK